jgi:hypothetical protein
MIVMHIRFHFSHFHISGEVGAATHSVQTMAPADQAELLPVLRRSPHATVPTTPDYANSGSVTISVHVVSNSRKIKQTLLATPAATTV